MNDFATDTGFGKIHNSLESIFQQYDSIEDLLAELDIKIFHEGVEGAGCFEENVAVFLQLN
jgi:hypothetical protein